MPEMPEIQAHAERLTDRFRGRILTKFVPFNFTALEDGRPRVPTTPTARAARVSGRRGKYLLLDFGDTSFVIHLMQGGRLLVDTEAVDEASRRAGAVPVRADRAMTTRSLNDALLLTEQG